MKYHALVPAVLLAFALPFPCRAQIPQDLRTAMQARLEAVWKKDVAAWSRLTSDEFTVVVPEGSLQTKADRVAALRKENPEPAHAIQREHVHVYGDTAVRRFVDGNEWVLEVWVRQDAAWRVVAAQVNFVKP